MSPYGRGFLCKVCLEGLRLDVCHQAKTCFFTSSAASNSLISDSQKAPLSVNGLSATLAERLRGGAAMSVGQWVVWPV